MNLFIKKSQGKLQNDAHLHDIIKEIKELANPFMDQSYKYRRVESTLIHSIRKEDYFL